MIKLWLILDQFRVPYFSIPILVITILVAVSILLMNLLGIRNPRYRSMLYLVSLVSPLAVYLWFPPSISMRYYLLMNTMSGMVENAAVVGKIFMPSVLGFLCLSGLVMGGLFLVFVYLRGPEFVLWMLRVTEISWDDNPELHKTVSGMVSRAGIPFPKLGILESIEPNAFTIGYGKRSFVVLTSGLLEVLNQRELEATVAHELGHIKNNDFHLSALISTLRVICFFNPVVYLLVSAISREREFMADAEGCRLIDDPGVLENTLVKINMSLVQLRMSHLTRFMIGALGISSFSRKSNIMSLHPPMRKRLSSISSLKGVDLLSRDRPKTVLAIISMCSVFFSLAVPLISGSEISSEPHRVFVRYHEAPSIIITDMDDNQIIVSTIRNTPVYYLKQNDELIVINDFVTQSLIQRYIREYQINYYLSETDMSSGVV